MRKNRDSTSTATVKVDTIRDLKDFPLANSVAALGQAGKLVGS